MVAKQQQESKGEQLRKTPEVDLWILRAFANHSHKHVLSVCCVPGCLFIRSTLQRSINLTSEILIIEEASGGDSRMLGSCSE